MAKEGVPTYSICTITNEPTLPNDFMVDRFGNYLVEHNDLVFPHKHSFYHLVYFTKGGGTHAIDFTHFDVKPGQVYFMIPGQVHSWNFKGETDGYIINFSGSYLQSFLADPNYLERFSFFAGDANKQVIDIPAQIGTKVTSLFEEIIEVAAHNHPIYNDHLKVLLLHFFHLAQPACRHSDVVSNNYNSVLLRNFLKLISTTYREKKLTKEYAQMLYVTPNHLNALVKDAIGKSAGELIRDRVILEAKRLLVNAGLSISQIATELNFDDNSYFARFLKSIPAALLNIFANNMNTKNIIMNTDTTLQNPSILQLFKCKCPRCRQGKMFVHDNPYELKHTMQMNDECPVCGQNFNIEVGFYFGSSYFSYALTVALSVATFIAWWLLIGFSIYDNRVYYWLVANALLLIALQPVFMRVARTCWLAFFVHYDPQWRIHPAAKPERTNKQQQNNW